MKFDRKLKEEHGAEIWQEYCGFLELSMEQYMAIQHRLMSEQMALWQNCALGRTLLDGKPCATEQEFRRTFPLTEYEDYADVLLQKRGDMLPDTPIVWIQTTWEGGRHPIKLAPFSKSMLDTYRTNVMSCLILATSTERGKFNVEQGNTMLYGLAPLPYATGLLPLLLKEEIDLKFLPPVEQAEKMSFSQRNKLGFKMGLSKGIDLFFGVGSVTYFVTQSFAALAAGGGSGGAKRSISPTIALRYLSAKRRCKQEKREMQPKDIFNLKGFMVAGTDNVCYKDALAEAWGIRPVEVFAGTEPGCVGCETWNRDGLYFFPDACFYEFIPAAEMERSLDDSAYVPRTVLMDEVVAGETYELVVSVLKGGAFMRYRVGDVYRCLGVGSKADHSALPRFSYVDRIPTVIDIAGFTRITEHSVEHVLELSGLPVRDWIACKEFTTDNRPFFHMYVELTPDGIATHAVTKEVLKEHMSVYFKYVDSDYKDLKKILGMDPLEITLLRCGSFASYAAAGNPPLRRINPPPYLKQALVFGVEGKEANR